MSRVALGFACGLLAACSGLGPNGVATDANGGGDGAGGTVDGGTQCGLGITFSPPTPIAGPGTQIRAVGNFIGEAGVITPTWTVTFDGAPVTVTTESTDGTQIMFDAPAAGIYAVTLELSGAAPSACTHGFSQLNVRAANANTAVYTLRVLPPAGPPQDTPIEVYGGAAFAQNVPVTTGTFAVGDVLASAAPQGAYLKFMPVASPGAYVEAYATPASGYSATLLTEPSQVLVVPTSSALAPQLTSWSLGMNTLTITAGAATTGTVLGPSGAAVAGAQVLLTAGGVPSTVAITASDGSFTVRTAFPASAPITVLVTPPATSGLPWLTASAAFDLTKPLQIQYAAALTSCNLAGSIVSRGGTAQPGALVTIAGALPGTAATASTGAVVANASGSARVSATAGGGGVLPALVVPAAALSAVVDLGGGDLAVAAVDAAACGTPTIDAPARTTATGVAQNAAGAPLGGVIVEATPTGALAGESPVRVAADSTGAFSILLASGGTYDVRFSDPGMRAAPLVVTGVTAASVPATAQLGAALLMVGDASYGLGLAASTTVVQLLCSSCSGLDAVRPIAETTTDATGNFKLAVPDPGTM